MNIDSIVHSVKINKNPEKIGVPDSNYESAEDHHEKTDDREPGIKKLVDEVVYWFRILDAVWSRRHARVEYQSVEHYYKSN